MFEGRTYLHIDRSEAKMLYLIVSGVNKNDECDLKMHEFTTQFMLELMNYIKG